MPYTYDNCCVNAVSLFLSKCGCLYVLGWFEFVLIFALVPFSEFNFSFKF